MTPKTKSDVQPQPTTPKPAPTTPIAKSTEPAPSKQQQTIAKLKAGWTEKGVGLKELVEKPDGKFIYLQPTTAWPMIRVGPTGGVDLPQLKSYPKAWDAAMDGLALYQKQLAREAKKAAATAPAPAAPAKSATPPQATTTTARKQKQHEAVEAVHA